MNTKPHTYTEARVAGQADEHSQRIVVKLGGEVMLNTQGLDSLLGQVAALVREGTGVVVVHGGGPQADALALQLGHRVRKVAGRRITDDDALEVAKMVYGGSINVELVAVLGRHGVRAVGLSGVDAGLVRVTRRPLVPVLDPVTGTEEWVDFGHVGDVRSVDTSVLELLMSVGCVPVVASLAADWQGRIYNVNADTVAQALAVALGACRLVLVTNVPGILRDPLDSTSVLPVCTPRDIQTMVAAGTISGGMLPKVHNCIAALRAGVRAVQILDGTLPHSPLLDSIRGSTTAGTLISDE